MTDSDPYTYNAPTCPICGRHSRRDYWSGAAAPCSPGCRLELRVRQLTPPLYRDTDRAKLPNPARHDYVGRWDPDGLAGRGLVLLGPTGSGKSRAMYSLIRRLVVDDRRQVAGFGPGDFALQVGRRFGDSPAQAADWLAGLRAAEILFFDDLGKDKATERVEAELFALIEYRLAHGRPILATTNLDGVAIEASMSANRGGPLVRRIRELCEIVSFPKTDPETPPAMPA